MNNESQPQQAVSLVSAILLLTGLSVISGCADSAMADDPARTAYVDSGCYQCHGYEGQGGFAGSRIGPTPLSLGAFVQLVRYPINLMPAYSKAALDDQKLTMIHQYLQSVSEPADPGEVRALLD